MSFFYSGDPATSAKDAVRYEVGDTDEKMQLIQDEEIYYALSKEGTVLKAAARCAEALAAKFAREATVRTATYAQLRGDLQLHFKELAKKLRARSITAGGFLCPSMTRSNKWYNASDSELVTVVSYKGIHRNRGVTPSKIDVD